ncbi:MAG TPA: glutathione synthase [Burkholderiaceae bacterium]|nr:glutathione synthase [Burkholderiaceae bacterium]
MSLLFIVDPLAKLKEYKDSTVAMMREAARRGHAIFACTLDELAYSAVVRASAHRLRITHEAEPWYEDLGSDVAPLTAFDAVLMRKDPPFDVEFLNATLLLSQARAEGARVINDPQALRDHNEKLAIAEFPQFIAPTLVTRDIGLIRQFHREHGDIVVKPLDGMGGSGVFRLTASDPNLNSILETITAQGQRTVMAQRYIPEIVDGDKRVLLIAGEAVPYCLARIPAPGESRGNLAAGGTGRAQPLSDNDRRIAAALGPALAARGLLLVGLDVIGNNLTEVNVTSPTCFVEITEQTGFCVAGMFIDALEKEIAGAGRATT